MTPAERERERQIEVDELERWMKEVPMWLLQGWLILGGTLIAVLVFAYGFARFVDALARYAERHSWL